jgi:hypothetical protein
MAVIRRRDPKTGRYVPATWERFAETELGPVIDLRSFDGVPTIEDAYALAPAVVEAGRRMAGRQSRTKRRAGSSGF